MEFRQRAALVQKQQLRLSLSPRQIQTQNILALSLADLRAEIEAELERNPALAARTVNLRQRENTLPPPREREKNRYRFTNGESHGNERGAASFLENTPAAAETLQEHLLAELALLTLDENITAAARLVIQNLDENGFNREDPAALLRAARLSAENPEATLAAALTIVQSLDPPGCATTDYAQSLSVQANLAFGEEEGALVAALFETLREFKAHRKEAALDKFARKYHLAREDAQEIYECLQTLNPYPGSIFSSAATRFIIPDIRVERRQGDDGDEFIIHYNNDEIPTLRIDPFFTRALQKSDDAAREFVKKHVEEAAAFIESVHERKATLLLVARAIVDFQRAFFEKGPKYLAPLTLRMISDTVKRHVSTISRSTHGKYMETEWGIYEMRRFFTGAVDITPGKTPDSEGGNRAPLGASKSAVKEILREILASPEGSGKTDSALAALLAERGYPLARRTVAKYRKELALGSSYERS